MAWTLFISVLNTGFHAVFKARVVLLFIILNLLWTMPLHAQLNNKTLDSSVKSEFVVTAKLAHQFITDQQPGLLGDGSQLVSLYYFGQNQDTSVVGLERVGEDYLPIRWLLIFKSEKLLGWYYPVGEFPARFTQGHLIFPVGSKAEDVFLYPAPPNLITIEGVQIPFITPNQVHLINSEIESNSR